MASHFSSDFFKNNRRQLRRRFNSDAPIVVTANGLLQRGADSSYDFSQDANFWYLTGIDEPDIVLVIDGEKDYLIVPGRSASRQAFDGSVSDEALRQRSGVADIYDDDAGWRHLKKQLQKTKQVATVAPPPAYIEQYGLYTNPARQALVAKLTAHQPDLQIHDVGQTLARMRMIKQPSELAAIQAAIDITIDSLELALEPAKLTTYKKEYELEAQIAYGFRSRGAAGLAFESIVASGKNACTLHNIANNGDILASDLVLTDVGAEVEHYAADITRTRSIKPATKRQLAVHQAVVDTQEYAISLLKPGTVLRDYEAMIESFLGEKLRELSLIKKLDHQAIRYYYPHATSHFLGLNVHDVGDYEQPLQPGSVITAEPGIYIPEEGIGVRIEDDILITVDGNTNLSQRLSTSIR